MFHKKWEHDEIKFLKLKKEKIEKPVNYIQRICAKLIVIFLYQSNIFVYLYEHIPSVSIETYNLF